MMIENSTVYLYCIYPGVFISCMHFFSHDVPSKPLPVFGDGSQAATREAFNVAHEDAGSLDLPLSDEDY